MNYIDPLIQLARRHDYFIGFDSDGCVFDTMELKHKECFCPAFIRHMGLQPVSRAAREVWEFVNLYSKTRGYNRFLALQRSLELLRSHREVRARHFNVPAFPALDAWIQNETTLGNPALRVEVEQNGNEELRPVLAWSLEVNERVADMVSGMTPFPGVMDVLQQGQEKADMIVVSQTPVEALVREWDENRMSGYIRMIAGQEHGTKAEHIQLATAGKGYAEDKILMIGDAPGDYKAAATNRALFYPIIPGQEDASWDRLAKEGLAKFFDGTFAGAYQQRLLEEFDAALPDHPPWC